MIKCIVLVDDFVFKLGVMELLTNIVERSLCRSIQFAGNTEEHSASQCNIIVIKLPPGAVHTCRPELIHRNKGLFIIFHEGSGPFCSLSECFSNCVNIRITDSVNHVAFEIREKIHLALEPSPQKFVRCQNCQARYLTKKQFLFMEGLFSGMSIKSISRNMNISSKTIYSQKNAIMRKFDIKNDMELVKFYQSVRKISMEKYLWDGFSASFYYSKIWGLC